MDEVLEKTFNLATEKYRYPFPAVPNGWFPVEISKKLSPGQLISKHALGNDLVLYRTESGVANVVGAYCPHMGAHIGKGGAVIGERIRCPFHHWEFGLTGHCERAFQAKNTPDATLEKFDVCEKNGTIFVWHDAQRRPPSWEIPDLEETTSDQYFFVGFHEYIIKTHPQEMAENQADLLHFRTVHKWNPKGMNWQSTYIGRKAELEIDVTENDEAIRTTNHVNRMHSTTIGPAYNFTRYEGKFRGLALLMFCPTVPGILYSPLLFWAHKSVPREGARNWMQGYLSDYSLDIDILENKRYLSNPTMSDADGPIHKMRKWYAQWYK